ncbi:glycoside hydrolase family 127 protein [Sphingobacterium paramultivorum]|uniref:Glycoside hydrolase family 127 protein n=1 Tax=Sphingobacterium paramultivorum TaxID=2886510 RepID=A0A7G5DXX0_9SPHI|nr:beta-L-arabinofuranosidase domain-containing protein [Sphingobacterium paramultivorum]QMV66595.1 glycoside hydrolase family 127 protein [Sphingobacterium paramultivorum]WSO15409.1 beta-L-arabinofuranosidase domain-containing protein [Sphingobacterium paramultivorum]
MIKRISFLSLLMGVGLAASAQSGIATSVNQLPLTGKNSQYINNRAPLKQNVLLKLPVGSIVPEGWLGKYLELQKDGLTGHLGEISAWLSKKNNAWLSTDGKGDYGWEEVPYWLKGYANLGYILKDPKIIAESKIWLEAALRSQRPDGYFGPLILRNNKPDLWGNMLMLWCLQSYYEYSGDQRVLTLMTNYFKWQANLPDSFFLKDYWENSRGGDNLLSVYWLYNRTQGNEWLMDLADKIHRNTANWWQKDDLPNWHNVNVAQCFREPATYYLKSQSTADLNATYDNFHFVRQVFGQVPGGMFGADENARPGYTDPRQGVETCGMVEQMASNEILLGITGDPFWADHAEEVAFNTYPAAVTADFKALRYITSPNMTISDSHNHAPGIDNNGPFLMMNPFSSRCCQHNHSQGWPYYAEHLYMATNDNGVAAVLYAASKAEIKVGNNQSIQIRQESNYPFEESLRFEIGTQGKTVDFPFYLRIPVWAKQAKVTVNGKSQAIEAGAKYIRIERKWKDGDKVELSLPMTIDLKTWAANKNSVSIQRGPLTYALKIKENYVKKDSKASAIGDSKWQETADPSKWPSYEILPASDWNYGLLQNQLQAVDQLKVVKRPWPKDAFPFDAEAVPISILVKAKRIDGWKIDENGLTGVLPLSPVESKGEVQEVELIPMGAARLRIAAFPTVK